MGSAAKPPVLQARRYYVVRQDSCWWVENELGDGLQACCEPGDAITWAIRRAQHDHAGGWDVMVCVEQPDGFYKTAWHS